MFLRRHCTSEENEVKPAAGMCAASPACTHARHRARIHSFSPWVFKRFSWTLTHKNHTAGHSGAAETSWARAVDAAFAFNSCCEIIRKHLLRKISSIIHSYSYFPRSTDPKLRFGSALTHGTTSGCSRASVCSLVDHFVCLLARNGCALFNFLTAESKSTQ